MRPEHGSSSGAAVPPRPVALPVPGPHRDRAPRVGARFDSDPRHLGDHVALPERDAARDWVDMTVVDRDGTEIGACAAVFADEATGRPEWVRVQHPDRTVIIPLLDAVEIEGRVRVVVSRADVLTAPSASGDRLTETEEVALYEHYGITASRAASDSLLPAAEATGDAPATGVAPPATDVPAPASGTGGATGTGPGVGTDEGRADQTPSAGRSRGPVVVAAAGAALGAVAIAAVRARGARPVLRPPTAPERARAASAAARARAAHVAASALPLFAAASDAARSGAAQVAASAGPLLAGASDATRSGAAQVAASAGPLLADASDAVRLGARSAGASALRAAVAAGGLATTAVSRAGAGLTAAGLGGLRLGGAVVSVPEAVVEGGHRVQKGWRKTKRTSALTLGLGTGYVLGARAGQERFQQLKETADTVTHRPEVQRVLARVGAARGAQGTDTEPAPAAGGTGGTPAPSTAATPVVPATDAGIPPGAVDLPPGSSPLGTDDDLGPALP
ncbi:PRC-barrel domain-containing protein [Geodermatophilus sabuli]